MKKKIFLMLALALMISCLLVVTASAADNIVKSNSNEYGELTTFDEAIGNTGISNLKDDGTIARSVITDGNGNYYTVPTVYLLTEHTKNRGDGVKGEMFNLKLSEISGKIGFTVSKNSIIRIEFPKDIKFICNGDENLSGAANMIECVMNNGVYFWDNGQRKAFTNCKKLQRIDLSGMIIDQPQAAFALLEYCYDLEYVKLPNAVLKSDGTYMEYDTNYMFHDCHKLKTIENMEGFFIGDKTLNYRTFSNCTVLEKVTLPDGLQKIEGRAIGGCKAITSIVIPDTVTEIGTTETVFESCTSLKKVVLPSGAVSFGEYCFEKCTALTDVWMPGAGSTFAKQVFGQCGSTLNVNFYFTTATSTVTVSNMDNNKDPFISALNSADERLKYNTPLTTKCAVFFDGNHYAIDDGNCGTKLLCTRCSTELEADEKLHKYEFVISYSNGFGCEGDKVFTCSVCEKSYSEKVKELFTCLGYSMPERDSATGFTLGFAVNDEQITAYQNNSGNTIRFGVFAAACKNIGEDGILTNNGEAIGNAISAEVTIKVVSFDLKIAGFTDDDYKNELLSIGAFVVTTDVNENSTVSYIQNEAPVEGAKYGVTSFNDVLNSQAI